MKITLLTATSSWLNKYHHSLTSQLEKRGHEVRLIHSKKDLEQGDVLFMLSCFELINSAHLALHRNNIVIHESLLPQGKGWSPASWQILENQNTIHLSLFEAVEALDAGDIYFTDKLELNGSELADEWREKLAELKIMMCLRYIDEYNHLTASPQSGEESFYPRRRPSDCQLDIDQSIREQFNLLRIVDNDHYPAFFEMQGERYVIKITKA